jgi:hypothetical protein
MKTIFDENIQQFIDEKINEGLLELQETGGCVMLLRGMMGTVDVAVGGAVIIGLQKRLLES